MRHDFLDRYSRLDSPVHNLPAKLKMLFGFVFVLAVVSVPFRDGWFFVAAPVFLTIAAILSRIPILFIVRRMLLLEPFAVGVSAMALFQHDGVAVFVSVLLKTSLCLLMMILVSNTTPFAEILLSLRKFHVPPLMITILALAYRYLFVLIDEGDRLQRARSSRTFVDGRRRRWYALASLIGQLFVRSTERAERIYSAMTSRGWQ